MIGTLLAGVLVLAEVKVAVVCGDAPLFTCSTVQPRLQAELEKQGKTVISIPLAAGEFALQPPASEPSIDSAKREMDEGVKLFYEGKLLEAKDKLEKANTTIGRSSLPAIATRVDIHLWRATVAYANQDNVNGPNAVRDALTLDPDHSVNTTQFSAALKDLVDNEKQKTIANLARVDVSFTELRPGAEVKVDEERVELVDGKTSVLPGRHWVTITAPGHQPLWRSFQSGDAAISGALAPTLSPEIDLAAQEGTPGPLKAFAQQLNVNALVVVSMKSELVGISVMNPDLVGAEGRFRKEAIGDMAKYASDRLVDRVAVPRATPRPTPFGDRPAYTLNASGALAMSVWQRDFKGSFEQTGSNFEQVNMIGVGPSVAVDFQMKGAIARADVAFLHYGMNTIESRVDADNPAQKESGGSATHFAIGVGYELLFGDPSNELRPRIAGLVGFNSEFYKSVELKSAGPNGKVLPMYGSHDWSGPFFRIEGAYPVATRVLLRANGGVWIAGYEEQPEEGGVGANGKIGSVAPIPLLGFGVDYPVNETLSISADARGQIRQVKYKADDSSLAVPDVKGATLDETLDMISVTARYRF